MQTSALKLGLRIGKNTLWLFLGRVGTQVLMMMFTIIVARRLGEVGLGEYAFIASTIFLANTVTSFGNDMLIIREIAAKKDFSLLPASLVVQLALSAISVALILLTAPLLPLQTDEVVRALQIYSFVLFPLSFYTVFSAALRGYEYMNSYMWLNLVIAMLNVTTAWFIIQPGSSIVILAWLLLVSQTAVTVLAAYICLTQISELCHFWHVSRKSIWRLLCISAPIALLGLLGMLYQKVSVTMLATLAGAAVTGLYSAAIRVVEASKIGHVALFGALYPAMALVQNGTGELKNQWQHIFAFSWKLLLALGGLTSLILFLLAIYLIPLLYGSNYSTSIPALRILAWTLIPYTLNTYLSVSYLSAGKERHIIPALSGSLLGLVVLNLVWIPRFGLIGVCWATLAAEWIQSTIFGLNVIKARRGLA